jgi:nondiscriminating glutamyl-tRNA synthetase
MHVTHVIRAEEHLSNTPRQLLVYDALGFEKPVFGHVSLILGTDHTKMSKRHGATSLDAYREKGYIPAGLNNFLALLGWAPSGEKEIFTMEEAIQEFSLDRVAKNPAVFDFKKLDWINGQHIRKMTPVAFWELAVPFMKQAGYMDGTEDGEKLEWLKKVVATAQTQIDYGAQIPEKVAMYFSDEFEFENEEAAAVLKEETAPMVMKALLEELKALPELNRDTVKAAFKKVQKANKLKGQQVYMPIRVTLTGNQHGPELAEMIPLFGLERTEKRILKSLEKAGVSL